MLRTTNQEQREGPSAGGVAQVPEMVTGQPRRVVVEGFQWRQMFSALRHRNFRLFFFGQMISLMGTWMQNTAQSWLVYQMTGSKVLLGIIAAAGTAPMLFFSTWGGSLADRYSKRRILLFTQSAMMMLGFVLAGLAWSGVLGPTHLVVLATLSGVAMAFDMPSRQAFLAEITSRDDLINAISLNSSIVNGARVVGPAAAGVLLAQTSAAVCFFVNGLSFLAVLAGLFLMRLKPHVRPHREGSAWQHAAEGFRYVWTHQQLRRVLSLFAIVVVFGWSYSVLMPAFAFDVLHVSEHGYGMLLAANGVGALTGALLVAAFHRQVSPRILAFGGLWVFCAMLILVSLTTSFPLVLLLLAFGGCGMMLFFSTANTLIQTNASDAMRGRVMGIWALVFGGMTPLGGLQAGFLSQYTGVPRTLIVGAIVCLVASLITLGFVRRQLSAEARAIRPVRA